MYTHTHIYIYLHLHLHTYTQIFLHTYTYIYWHMHTYAYTYIQIHTYAYIGRKGKVLVVPPDPFKFPWSFSSHGKVIEIGKRGRWREGEERKEKKSKKEKRQAKEQKAAQASTPQWPRHKAEEEALTTHRSPLKKVQIDDKRIDHRKIDDHRVERQSDLAISAPSEPARLLQRTTNPEQDVDELREIHHRQHG